MHSIIHHPPFRHPLILRPPCPPEYGRRLANSGDSTVSQLGIVGEGRNDPCGIQIALLKRRLCSRCAGYIAPSTNSRRTRAPAR
jgi:hypothetical protein